MQSINHPQPLLNHSTPKLPHHLLHNLLTPNTIMALPRKLPIHRAGQPRSHIPPHRRRRILVPPTIPQPHPLNRDILHPKPPRPRQRTHLLRMARRPLLIHLPQRPQRRPERIPLQQDLAILHREARLQRPPPQGLQPPRIPLRIAHSSNIALIDRIAHLPRIPSPRSQHTPHKHTLPLKPGLNRPNARANPHPLKLVCTTTTTTTKPPRTSQRIRTPPTRPQNRKLTHPQMAQQSLDIARVLRYRAVRVERRVPDARSIRGDPAQSEAGREAGLEAREGNS
ncbi:hypothetical protein BJY04DRAFT_196929 [Aspergillus karnatakaensis]|uniref:uncharacterized protein n=1 Tax=Aspergillus karnatakaensis TaxID=1810916 RepID=UPI003CCD5453